MTSGRVSAAVRERVRQAADDRCGYCRSPQAYVLGRLEIDHIVPVAKGGSDDEDNLWLACRLCNSYKGVQTEGEDIPGSSIVTLYNPRTQVWSDHFRWDEEGIRIVGLTACGRATVNALRLNNVLAMTVRRAWARAGWHPPEE